MLGASQIMQVINKKDGRDFTKAINLQMSGKLDRECVQALIDDDGYKFGVSVYDHQQQIQGIFPTLVDLDSEYQMLSREQQLRCTRVFGNLIRQDYY